ncbi:MAG: enoyl-CoA hydratase/isomerase family protein, partial [Bacillota bacterium]
MEFDNLIFEKDGPIAVLTLNRPKALNALNADTLKDLDKAIDLVAADDEVKVVI